MIKGKICNLRPILPKDLELIRQWRLSEFVESKFPSWDIITPFSQEQWYEKVVHAESNRYFLIEDVKGTPAGVIYLIQIDRRNRHAEFGYYIGEPAALNSGISLEAEYLMLDYAFNYEHLKKVWCETMAFNTHVLKIHERFGFQKDGVLRSHAFRQGAYQDLILQSILDDEFKENQNAIGSIIKGLAER